MLMLAAMKHTDLQTRLVPPFVLAHAAVFLAFGVAFAAAPASLGGLLGIELTSATGIADFRAIYGGMSFGVGLLFAAALTRREWTPPALFTIATTSGFLLLGRLLTVAIEAEPVTAPIYLFSAMELSSLLAALWLLRPGTKASAQGVARTEDAPHRVASLDGPTSP